MTHLLRACAFACALAVALGCSPAAPAQPASGAAPSASTARPAPLDGVRFVSREAWGAAPATYAMTPQEPRELVIHHTAFRQRPDLAPEAKMLTLQRFSQSADRLEDGRAKVRWADVPYHFYIAEDGTVLEGRDVRYRGDTNTGYDLDGKVQVVLEGNFMEETPSAAQMDAVLALARALAARYRIAPEAVSGHRDHAGTVETSCPGDALGARLDEIRAAVASARD